MDIKKSKFEKTKQQVMEEAGNATAAVRSIVERSAEIYGQAEQAVSHVYDKTAQALSENYEKAKSYSSENPGKTILTSLAIGVGLGFLLGTCRRR
jgi:ElaB/YqjD/DUF883 family membrane-anchored ribosome-binding protein